MAAPQHAEEDASAIRLEHSSERNGSRTPLTRSLGRRAESSGPENVKAVHIHLYPIRHLSTVIVPQVLSTSLLL